MTRYLCLLLCVFLLPRSVAADSLLVAVASNFGSTLERLVADFEPASGHRITIASASSGVHYAQIMRGAPFDLFLSADAERPRLLEQQGMVVPGTRFIYAVGQLVLWSASPGLVDDQGDILNSGDFPRLAIASPESAPYGLAALQTLERLGLLSRLEGRLVTGTNISQTFQFIATGAAPLGFIARSQINEAGSRASGSFWLVPEHLYDPISQEAVLLRDTPAGRQFMAYLKSSPARALIGAGGYGLPDP